MPFPAAGEITSPFGWRTHPIFGTSRFHRGIDIGADLGDPVQAVAPGTVVYAGYAGGYGLYVEIDHGNGLVTCYAHNSELFVSEGQSVALGTLVSHAGSTGYSTGPHLHFEVQLNGTSVNPMDYLDGSRVMPEGTATDGFFYVRSDYDETAWSFDSYYDFAKPIRDLMNLIATKAVAGIRLVIEDVKWIFFALVMIDLAVAAMMNLFEDKQENVLNWLARRIVRYGFALWLILNWGSVLANGAKDLFVHLGATASSTSYEAAEKLISDPTLLVQKGASLVGPVFAYISSYHGIIGSVFPPILLIPIILALGILACFVFIGFEIAMAYMEFYIITTLSVVTLGFSPLKQTKFLAEKGIGSLIYVSFKLMIFTIIGAVLTDALQDQTPVGYEFLTYLKILCFSIFLVCFASRLSKTAGKVIKGATPKL